MMMPALNLTAANLTAEEMAIAANILATQGKNKGRLRQAKPKIEYEIYEKNGGKYRRSINGTGETAYVWRMVAFQLCAFAPHCCLPVMADFDLPQDDCKERRVRAKELDVIADKIVASVPINQRGGLLRWSQALHGTLPAGVSEVLPGIYS